MLVNQWTILSVLRFKRNINNGFWNLALGRTDFNNDIEKYEDNQNPTAANQSLDIISSEKETKLRFDVNKNRNG